MFQTLLQAVIDSMYQFLFGYLDLVGNSFLGFIDRVIGNIFGGPDA